MEIYWSRSLFFASASNYISVYNIYGIIKYVHSIHTEKYSVIDQMSSELCKRELR